MTGPVLEIIDVSRDYRGLRPLRIERLDVAAGEQVAILGLDQMTAEVFVNLVTGATVPDRGDVRIFGRPTAAIADSTEWLALVDRFGIVSERAVLLDALTVIQNLSMPFSLEIEPPGADVRARAEALAQEADLPEAAWDRPLGELEGAARMRVRMARRSRWIRRSCCSSIRRPPCRAPRRRRWDATCAPSRGGAAPPSSPRPPTRNLRTPSPPACCVSIRRQAGLLLLDHSARDSGAAADAGSLSPVIPDRIAVENDRRAVGVEERQRSIGERHARRDRVERGVPLASATAAADRPCETDGSCPDQIAGRPGSKCPPAAVKSGSHLPTAWRWTPWLPGFNPWRSGGFPPTCRFHFPFREIRAAGDALARDDRVRLCDDGAVARRLGEFLDDGLGDRLGVCATRPAPVGRPSAATARRRRHVTCAWLSPLR